MSTCDKTCTKLFFKSTTIDRENYYAISVSKYNEVTVFKNEGNFCSGLFKFDKKVYLYLQIENCQAIKKSYNDKDVNRNTMNFSEKDFESQKWFAYQESIKMKNEPKILEAFDHFLLQKTSFYSWKYEEAIIGVIERVDATDPTDHIFIFAK